MSHIVLTVLTIVMFGIVTSHVVLSLTIGPTPPSRFCPSISCVVAEYLPCLNVRAPVLPSERVRPQADQNSSCWGI